MRVCLGRGAAECMTKPLNLYFFFCLNLNKLTISESPILYRISQTKQDTVIFADSYHCHVGKSLSQTWAMMYQALLTILKC